jgi:hypothetical protein
MQRIEFGLKSEGQTVFINLYDGTKGQPAISRQFPLPKNGIVIVQFEPQGTAASFFDSQGSLLQSIDIVQASAALHLGVFAEGVRVFALSSAPSSGMTIEGLQLLGPTP